MKRNIQAVHNPLKGNQRLNVSKINFQNLCPPLKR